MLALNKIRKTFTIMKRTKCSPVPACDSIVGAIPRQYSQHSCVWNQSDVTAEPRAGGRVTSHYSHHQTLWSNMRTRVSHHRLMAQDKCVLLWPNIPPVWNEEDWILFGGVIVLQMFTIWFDCLHTRSNVFIMRLVSRQNQSKGFSGVVVKVIMFPINQTT